MYNQLYIITDFLKNTAKKILSTCKNNFSRNKTLQKLCKNPAKTLQKL
jgi:hypothetical protein